jgi:anti-sigma factor RsiW
MSDSTTHVLIAYIDGDLPDAEKTALEQRVATNTALQAELESLQLAKMAMQSHGLRQDIATILEQMMKEPQEETGHTILARWMLGIMRIAASVLFVAFTISIYLYFTLTPTRLFNKQYRAFTIPASRALADSALPERAWQQKNYGAVIRLASTMPVTAQRDHFFAAQSYLVLSDLPKAISNFEAVLRLNRRAAVPLYQDESEYYLALAWLAHQQPAKALPRFIRIFNDNTHLYHDQVNWWFMARLHLLKLKG